MSNTRNTILIAPSGEYLRYLGTEEQSIDSCLTMDRNEATPYTADQVKQIKEYFELHYRVKLESQSWILLNAKHKFFERQD